MICNPADDLLHTSLHTWVFFRVFSALPDETVVVHQRLVKLAPKVGLEPTTTRLTAACSTIELLWMPHGTLNLQMLPIGVNGFSQVSATPRRAAPGRAWRASPSSILREFLVKEPIDQHARDGHVH